jgi:hypothetical protein
MKITNDVASNICQPPRTLGEYDSAEGVLLSQVVSHDLVSTVCQALPRPLRPPGWNSPSIG